MTVSPRRPQVGTPAPEGVSNPVAANDNDGKNPPPTLLRLPNLNAASAVPPAQEMAAPEMVNQNQPTQDPSVQNPLMPSTVNETASAKNFSGGHPQPVQPTATPHAVNGQSTPTAAWAPTASPQPASVRQQPVGIRSSGMSATGRQDERQTENHQVTDQAFAGRTFPDLSDQEADAPAGRSWMEIAQQHGVVVLLLLIVVAAAVFTGRGRDVGESDVAIVDAVDLFGVEDGIAADVPMPSHTHDAATGAASSPQAGLLPDSSDITFSEQATDTGANVANRGTSVASLAPPRSATEHHSVAANGQNRPPIVENQFAQQLNAKPVANRFNKSTERNSDIAFNAPSLEQLANSLPDQEAMVTSEPATIPAFGKSMRSRTPIRSKTPVGISDWTQYLPQLPSATSK